MHDKAHYKNVSPKSMEQKNQSKSFGKIIHLTKVMLIWILLSFGILKLSILLSSKASGIRTSILVTSVCSVAMVSPAKIVISSFVPKTTEHHKQ